jgi:hypothetical protein
MKLLLRMMEVIIIQKKQFQTSLNHQNLRLLIVGRKIKDLELLNQETML